MRRRASHAPRPASPIFARAGDRRRSLRSRRSSPRPRPCSPCRETKLERRRPLERRREPRGCGAGQRRARARPGARRGARGRAGDGAARRAGGRDRGRRGRGGARRGRSSRRPSGASASCPRRRRRPASWSTRSTGAGEWVAAGAPVVSLLPPGNVKVRFFVPEPQLGAIEVGDRGAGRAAMPARPDLVAEISFIAPEAEYTPPVIYSREMRAKLVYLVEAKPRQPRRAPPGPAGRRDPAPSPDQLRPCAMQPARLRSASRASPRSWAAAR